MSNKEQKKILRETLLERRGSISEQAFRHKSDQIISTLRNLPAFEEATVIHCYVSMNKRREVNTHNLIKEMISVGKDVVAPVTQMASGTLRHIKLQSFENLEANKWGVLEPVNESEIPVTNLELIIVPMVGGDKQRNRIGYGKGFYDRFLSQVSCPKIGLLFETCLVDMIATEPFDVPLDAIVSETGIY